MTKGMRFLTRNTEKLTVVWIMVLGLGIALAIGVSVRSRPRRFASEEEARRAWARRYPDLPAGTVTLTAHSAAALVMTADGPGLVWPPGSGNETRLLHGARARPTPKGLDLRLPDPSAPRLRLVLPAQQVAAWARIIDTLARTQR